MAEHSTHIRHVLLYEFESGHPAAEAHRNLSQLSDTEAPSERSVRTWFQRFKVGNKELEDESCSGRPTAISFDELKNVAEQNPYESVRYLAASFGCLLSTVSNGLRSLGMVKKKRAWCAGEEMPGPFVKCEIHEKKVMLSVWWGVHGIYRFELLPDNTTVTAEVYCAQLQRLADKICKEHPKLYNKILELGWEVLPHPPYSPDLAPSYYHLFRSLQHHLEEKRYDDRDHLENDLRAFFAFKSPKFYAKGICDLVRRWQKVVDDDGDYLLNNKMF